MSLFWHVRYLHAREWRRRGRKSPVWCQIPKTALGVSDRNELLIDLAYELSPGLNSLSPPQGRGTRGCQDATHAGVTPNRTARRGTPLVRALAPHGVSGYRSRKPLGLNP